MIKTPLGLHKKNKNLIQDKNNVYKSYQNSKNNSSIHYLRRLKVLQEDLHNATEVSKLNYYSRVTYKLTHIQKNTKVYWTLLKRFFNIKKIPLIPPLFLGNEYVADFKKKAELFNSFFAKQGSLISNSSELPLNLHYATEKRLNTLSFSNNDIEKIMQNLDPNKAHGHDKISIRMIKICGKSICKPLQLIFSQCIDTGSFLLEWKKSNVVSVHKKGDKQCLKKYRPVSLLPICGKILERLIFNEMFRFFIENNLISSNQSGFKPGDSCINQLLSITHEIYKPFDDGFEVRGVFLDISKAFDKVWHKGIIFKLKQNGISGKLFSVLSDFLKDRKQRVILNEQVSSWTGVNAGATQGSILGPLLFLVYINDLADGLSSNAKLFADDTSLFSVIHDVGTSANELNNDLYEINKWAFQWKMSFNPDPSKQVQEIIFSRKTKKISHHLLRFNNSIVFQTPYQKHPDIFLDARLIFEEHLKVITTKVNKAIGLFRKLQKTLPRPVLMTIYKTFVRPYLDYGAIIYDQAYNETFHQKLVSIRYNACLALSGAIRGSSREKPYHELGLESLKRRRWYRKICLFYKIFKENKPVYLFNLIPTKSSNYNTRNTDNITLFHTKHNFFKNSFFPSTVIEWNRLDPNLRSVTSLSVFKKNLLKFIRLSPNSVFNFHNCKGIKCHKTTPWSKSLA